uniref:Putative secreted protein n=1 Tax=Anopheles triannulatus TaxID=58253 RepID=A0A2M4B1W9_9DIPT
MLVLLHLVHLVRLVLGRAVVMNNADTAAKRHRDGHVGFRNRVHGRGNQRRLQHNFLRQRGGQIDLVGRKIDESRENDKVVVRQAIALLEQLLARKAILQAFLFSVGTVFHRC